MNRRKKSVLVVIFVIGMVLSLSGLSVTACIPSKEASITLIQNPLLVQENEESNVQEQADKEDKSELQKTRLSSGNTEEISQTAFLQKTNPYPDTTQPVVTEKAVEKKDKVENKTKVMAGNLTDVEKITEKTKESIAVETQSENTNVTGSVDEGVIQNNNMENVQTDNLAQTEEDMQQKAQEEKRKKEKEAKLKKKKEAIKKKKIQRKKQQKKRAKACMAMVNNTSDQRILERIVEAEAGGESIKGRILVANVILNRVKHKDFPNTIKGVVFAHSGKRYQFSPIADGRYYSVHVSAGTKKAVKKAMQGADGSQGALYFMERSAADSSNVTWFDTALTRLFRYGCHEFYK